MGPWREPGPSGRALSTLLLSLSLEQEEGLQACVLVAELGTACSRKEVQDPRSLCVITVLCLDKVVPTCELLCRYHGNQRQARGMLNRLTSPGSGCSATASAFRPRAFVFQFPFKNKFPLLPPLMGRRHFSRDWNGERNHGWFTSLESGPLLEAPWALPAGGWGPPVGAPLNFEASVVC